MSTRAARARCVAAYVGGLVGAAGLWLVLSALFGATPAQADAAEPDPRPHEADGPISEVVHHVVRDGARPAVGAATESVDAAARDAVRVVATVAPQASPTAEAVVDGVVDPATDHVGPAVGAAGSKVVEASEAAEQVVAEGSTGLLPSHPKPTEPHAPTPAATEVDGWLQGVAGTTLRTGSGRLLTSVPAGEPVPAVVPGLSQASSTQPAAPSDRALPTEPVDDGTPAGTPCVTAAASSASSSGAGAAGSLGVVPTRSLVSAPAFWSGPAAVSPAPVPAPDGLPACTPD